MAKVRVSKKGRPFKEPNIDLAIRTQLKKEGSTLKGLYNRTVSTWKNKPDFTIEILAKYSLEVGTENQIFEWVDKGTRKNYPIPKNPLPYPLRFNSNFTPKTKPNVLKSFAGSSSPPVVRPMQVIHPGIKPRNFSDKIKKSYERRFKENLDKAIRDAIAKGGT